MKRFIVPVVDNVDYVVIFVAIDVAGPIFFLITVTFVKVSFEMRKVAVLVQLTSRVQHMQRRHQRVILVTQRLPVSDHVRIVGGSFGIDMKWLESVGRLWVAG